MDLSSRIEAVEAENRALRELVRSLQSRFDAMLPGDGTITASGFVLVDEQGRTRGRLCVADDRDVDARLGDLTTDKRPPRFGPQLELFDENGVRHVYIGMAPTWVNGLTQMDATRKDAFMHIGKNLRLVSYAEGAEICMLDGPADAQGSSIAPEVLLSTRNGLYVKRALKPSILATISTWLRALVGRSSAPGG